MSRATMVIGLTGGIASGKSTVAKMFEAYDVLVLYADIIAKAELQKGTRVHQQVAEAFPDTVDASGNIDKNALARHIFDDKHKRETLNAIVHPAVRKVIERHIRLLNEQGEPMVVLEVPLLFESGFDALCDHTVVVYADAISRKKRLMVRDGIDETYAKKKMAAQMSLEEKMARADTVIDNSGPQANTRRAFDQFMQKIRHQKS